MGSEDEMIFCQEDFMSKSFDVFEDMRQKKELVDFKINLENRCVLGHRLVLAARIPYFRKIFCCSETEVSLEEVDRGALESVIDFAYRGKIKITFGNVVSLISVSKVLQLPQVYDACWEFLKRRFSSNNVLEFRRLAEDHGCTTFSEAADNYMRQNFEEFSNSDKFLDLSFQQFKEIISRNDIKVSTEEKVFEAVIRWIKSSESERKDLLPELLSAVRMYFLTPDYLIRRVSAEELVKSSLLCRDLVDEAKSYHLLPDERPKLCRLQSQPRFYEKKAVDPPVSSQSGDTDMHHWSDDTGSRRSLIYSVYSNDSVTCVKQFDAEDEKWLHVLIYEKCLDLEAVVSVGEVIYIFAGLSVYTFEISTMKWFFLCEKDLHLFSSRSVAYNGKIYFFGSSKSATAHYFDLRQKIFLEECQMKRACSFPGVALLNSSRGNSSTSDTFIYITGGRAITACSDVERYNPEIKEWSNVPPMLCKRYEHGCCHLKEKIYVCGGKSASFFRLSSAEMFDPLTNKWNLISSMTEINVSVTLVSHEGKLYVWGERTRQSMYDSNVEIYDPKNNEWKIGAPIVERDRDHGGIFLVKS